MTLYTKPVYVFTMVCVCRRGTVRLGISKVTQVDFVPKEMVSYSKETQTPTETLTHTDQKAGKTHRDAKSCFPTLLPWLNQNRIETYIKCVCADEEEDEEITAPPPVEDSQEEKDEQGEQQEEGKKRSL